ncbi:hypothetical protein MASR1M8_16170 [Thermomonas brevis]
MNAVLKPEPGRVIRGESAEVYHQRDKAVASASGLKQMLRSPAHFRHWAEHPDDDKSSAALDFGRALHCAVLEPDVFAQTYMVLPHDAPQRPTAAMLGAKKRSPESEARVAWWAAWDADNAGRIMLSANDYDRVQGMAESARQHPVARGLLAGGEREMTFRWTDEETGIVCKSRADLYAAGEFLMDLKSCRDASPDGFARAVTSYMYDLQQAHYLDGIRTCGDSIRWFVFLAIESEAPYVAQPHILDVRAEERGWKLRQRAITRQAECLRNNTWPGYSDGLNELSLPAYAYFGEEE